LGKTDGAGFVKQIATGAVGALLLAGIGAFWISGKAEVERGAPPPAVTLSVDDQLGRHELPDADVAGMIGPAPPEASELSREQRRFFRYDRNYDWRISRTEMLSSRTDAFRKLDKDGNNLLTFEEWAVTTVDKFETADANDDNELTPVEFATTRPKRAAPRKKCAC
jgi:hypothetical protein